MKDWGIYSGTGISTYCIYLNSDGYLVKFSWWELLFIAVFFLIKIVFWGITCGFIATIVSDTIKQVKEQWIGKTKELKQLT